MTERTIQIKDDLADISSEALIGRRVQFVLRPELFGQITSVSIFRAGRTLSVAYFEGDEAKSLNCDDFQVSLVDG